MSEHTTMNWTDDPQLNQEENDLLREALNAATRLGYAVRKAKEKNLFITFAINGDGLLTAFSTTKSIQVGPALK